MLNNSTENKEKKSLKERFFLVIGMVFFLVYLATGLAIIFWKKFPIDMKPGYRIAFGVVLIVNSFNRFYRIVNDNKE
jgi:Kef-type K+ transport system membrane component KefB